MTPAAKPLVRRDRVFEFLVPRVVDGLDLSHGTALYMEDVSVSFDGFKAINKLNFHVDTGELRAVIGPNGAGKTTMMDIITGRTRPDVGSVWFGQRMNLLRMRESEIANAGIGRKFQKPTVFEAQSVASNLELAMAGGSPLRKLLGLRSTPKEQRTIAETAELIGLQDHQHTLAARLSHGQKQWLEIGMLLMQNPVLMLIDEPAAGMTHQEMDRTVALLKQLAGDRAVVVVEHDMEFVRALNTRVTVLHQGSVLCEGDMDQVQNDARVRDVYLGEDTPKVKTTETTSC